MKILPAEEFSISYKAQNDWNTTIALDFLFAGVGAGLILLALIFSLDAGLILGLAFLALGVLTLLSHLSKPFKFWLVFANLSRSWLSKGSLMITLLFITGLLLIVARYDIFPVPFQDVIVIFTGIFALLVMLYPGFAMASSPSIPFWNSIIMPVVFLISSLTSGVTLILFLAVIAGSDEIFSIFNMQLIFILSSFAVLFIFYFVKDSALSAGKKSQELITKGALSGLFIVGAVLIGLVIPLIVALYYFLNTEVVIYSTVLIGSVVLLRLIGDYILRYLFLRAGYYNKLI